MQTRLLSEEDIQDSLKELTLWNRVGSAIAREFVASNFAGAIGIVNAIAVLSEAVDHHPDILIFGWNKVRVTISTHDQGGLTEKDFQLAMKIEELKF